MNNRLLARVSLGIQAQGEIGYIYNLDSLNSFKAEDGFDEKTKLSVGSIFMFNGTKYRISKIETIHYTKNNLALGRAGGNLHGIDEKQDYNIEIMYFVVKME